jgi:hypothetical protein
MKIIFSDNKEPFLEQDARRIMKIEEQKRTMRIVASVHKALTPRECERCNKTYWNPVDTWSAYCSKGCEEEDRKVGF